MERYHYLTNSLLKLRKRVNRSPALQTPKRQYRKRGREDEEDKVDGPEMSKEEKEERKKHRPRTRSGRVSKPPKHMVKDYKHIHVLDWDEDYDDSDGGYSDYKGSDEEGNSKGNREKSGFKDSHFSAFREVDETEGQVVTEEQQASIFQTEDGILIIQNPDGTTFQLQGAQGIPLETVQALLAMEGQFEPGDQIQTEIQQ
nr:hypothetical protein BaRGS_012295 [Batillaria attramentaria]